MRSRCSTPSSFHRSEITDTPYGTGPSPIYYSSGYIPGKDFWRLGFILGLLYFVTYIVIGVPWLRFLGF